MSFDLNMVSSSFKPKVENTFLGKGGGNGSTGYFNQGRNKNHKENESNLFSDDKNDILEKMGTSVGIENIEGTTDILSKIKSFLKF